MLFLTLQSHRLLCCQRKKELLENLLLLFAHLLCFNHLFHFHNVKKVFGRTSTASRDLILNNLYFFKQLIDPLGSFVSLLMFIFLNCFELNTSTFLLKFEIFYLLRLLLKFGIHFFDHLFVILNHLIGLFYLILLHRYSLHQGLSVTLVYLLTFYAR
jgi:hypothetical protein